MLIDFNAHSRAQALFEKIKTSADAVAILTEMTSGKMPAEELEFVDFKSGAAARKDQHDALRELWAKCLSCYANSDGGVVIFGIEAPKGKAERIAPVEDIEDLVQRLKELVPRLTEPPVQRVEIEKYYNPPGSRSGFVVCLIPPSPWRPHQVRTNGQPGLFYVRATDNCIPCNHATLRALFNPQSIANIRIIYRLRVVAGQLSQTSKLILICRLHNLGPASASEVFVLAELPEHVRPQFNHLLWDDSASSRRGHSVLAKRAIHPTEIVDILTCEIAQFEDQVDLEKLPPIEQLKFSIWAKDQLSLAFNVELDAQHMSFDKEIGVDPLPTAST